MDESRRGFLRGLLAAPVAGGLLLRAEPKALELFKPVPNEPVCLAKETSPASPDLAQPGMLLFTASGLPVAVVTEIVIQRDALETTRFGDTFRQFDPSPYWRGELRAELMGSNIDAFTSEVRRTIRRR